MKNFIQTGANLPVVATATIASGDFVVVGGLTGVAQGKAAVGESVELVRSGVFELPKLSAQAWTVGAKVYWSSGDSQMTTVASGNTLVGFAAEAANNPSDTGLVFLDGVTR